MVNNISEEIVTKTDCNVFGLPRSTYCYQPEPEVQDDYLSERELPDFAYSQQEKFTSLWLAGNTECDEF